MAIEDSYFISCERSEPLPGRVRHGSALYGASEVAQSAAERAAAGSGGAAPRKFRGFLCIIYSQKALLAIEDSYFTSLLSISISVFLSEISQIFTAFAKEIKHIPILVLKLIH